MTWINKNWKALTVVGGILGVSAYASKYFDVEPVDDFEAETQTFEAPKPRLSKKQQETLDYIKEATMRTGRAYITGETYNMRVIKNLFDKKLIKFHPEDEQYKNNWKRPSRVIEADGVYFVVPTKLGNEYRYKFPYGNYQYSSREEWLKNQEPVFDGTTQTLDEVLDELFGAEDFGAESKLPKLTPKQMDFLRYSSWARAYEAYATGIRTRGWHPTEWKEDYTICKKITHEGYDNAIARKTLQSLLEKKVVKATDTSYVRQDGRIRKSYAEQVNENPSLVKNITQICLVLTPIGLEILKRMFARNFKDVVGWKIELTFPSGDTAYLHDVPNDIGKALDSHIGDVKWDSQTERFGAEDFGADDCPSCKNNPGSYDYWGNGPFECYWCKTRGYYDAETDYDDYIDRIFTFIDEKVGTEYFPSDEDEEEVARFKKDFNDEFDEVGKAIEDANDWSWNEILEADEDDEAYIRDRYGEPLENMSRARKIDFVADSLKDLPSLDMLFTIINNLSTKQGNQLINRLYAGIREGSIRTKPFRDNVRANRILHLGAESESFESYDYYTIERDDDWEFDEAYMEKQDAERILKLLKIVRRKATGSNARYAKNYAREAENAYYQYGMKGLKVQVAYVLSNLGGWRGDEAKEVKAELRKLTK